MAPQDGATQRILVGKDDARLSRDDDKIFLALQLTTMSFETFFSFPASEMNVL
jgi:hypothetical protein